MKVAADTEGTLHNIEQRKDDLTKQADWSQLTLLQEHMLVAEVTEDLLLSIVAVVICFVVFIVVVIITKTLYNFTE